MPRDGSYHTGTAFEDAPVTDFRYDAADDTGLSRGERMSSPRREPGLMSAVAAVGVGMLVRAYLRLVHRLHIDGRDRLPCEGAYVIVANHASHLDVLCLLSALPRGRRAAAFPVAAGDTFFDTGAKSLLAALCLNAVPIGRGRVGRHALDDLRHKLTRPGTTLLIFPEGTRSRTGDMGRFKPGLGMLIGGTGVPIVPCGIIGAFEACPPGATLPRPKRVRVRVGQPIDSSNFAADREGWQAMAQALEAQVRRLVTDNDAA